MPVGKYSSNYSKWDALELSDDSDIEGHPNVDHKSLVRWKQQDIHEKREKRKQLIASHRANIALNKVLIPRFDEILKNLEEGGPRYYSKEVERLKTQGSPEKPTDLPNQPTYDQMIEALLLKVWDEVKKKGVGPQDEKLGDELLKGLKVHVEELKKLTKRLEGELEKELEEQQKKITSDDIHDGFDSTNVAKPKPAPPAAVKPKQNQTIEVLNPKATSSSAPPAQASAPTGDEDDDEELPELTPSLLAFSKIPVGAYEQSFGFIQQDQGVFVEGAVDALFVAGFEAEMKGDSKYAKQCIHQGSLIQFCQKLGKDGVSIFFKRVTSGDPRAETVFVNDWKETYAAMAKRAKKAAEETKGRETIQLVTENPDTTIEFNVPDGPPPENLILEGPGTEGLDIEEVRKALQTRWDIFCGFSPEFQEALKSGELEKVNDVLGKMEVPEAESVVELLNIGGIMSFAEGGVRDATGN
jgi:cell division cycle protein 37